MAAVSRSKCKPGRTSGPSASAPTRPRRRHRSCLRRGRRRRRRCRPAGARAEAARSCRGASDRRSRRDSRDMRSRCRGWAPRARSVAADPRRGRGAAAAAARHAHGGSAYRRRRRSRGTDRASSRTGLRTARGSRAGEALGVRLPGQAGLLENVGEAAGADDARGAVRIKECRVSSRKRVRGSWGGWGAPQPDRRRGSRTAAPEL